MSTPVADAFGRFSKDLASVDSRPSRTEEACFYMGAGAVMSLILDGVDILDIRAELLAKQAVMEATMPPDLLAQARAIIGRK